MPDEATAAGPAITPHADNDCIDRAHGDHDRHWAMAWHYLELSDLGHLARAGPLLPQAMERPHAEMVSATPNEEMAASWVGNRSWPDARIRIEWIRVRRSAEPSRLGELHVDSHETRR